MFGKLTPLRIIVFGGLIITLGYAICVYFPEFMDFSKIFNLGKKSSVVEVKNLFHKNGIDNNSKQSLNDKQSELETQKKLQLLDESSLTPVTENERQFLITKARESIEGRLDPFSQGVQVKKQIEQQKIDLAEEEPKDIPMLRKQIELVGIISSNHKDLALINIYDANYSFMPDDKEDVKKEKLKTALSMAVPNRFEVSLLDPVEDWYVKQVVKGKARDDEPYIELVRGSKKFKIKVGQKLLLPEQDTI